LSDTPVALAWLAIAPGVLPIFTPITRVGVFPAANCFNCLFAAGVQGFPLFVGFFIPTSFSPRDLLVHARPDRVQADAAEEIVPRLRAEKMGLPAIFPENGRAACQPGTVCPHFKVGENGVLIETRFEPEISVERDKDHVLSALPNMR